MPTAKIHVHEHRYDEQRLASPHRARAPALHKEPLTFEYIPLSQRSYK